MAVKPQKQDAIKTISFLEQCAADFSQNQNLVNRFAFKIIPKKQPWNDKAFYVRMSVYGESLDIYSDRWVKFKNCVIRDKVDFDTLAVLLLLRSIVSLDKGAIDKAYQKISSYVKTDSRSKNKLLAAFAPYVPKKLNTPTQPAKPKPVKKPKPTGQKIYVANALTLKGNFALLTQFSSDTKLKIKSNSRYPDTVDVNNVVNVKQHVLCVMKDQIQLPPNALKTYKAFRSFKVSGPDLLLQKISDICLFLDSMTKYDPIGPASPFMSNGSDKKININKSVAMEKNRSTITYVEDGQQWFVLENNKSAPKNYKLGGFAKDVYVMLDRIARSLQK